MSVLDKLQAHYKSFGKQSAEIPEIDDGGKPLKVFWNIPNQAKLAKALKESGVDSVEFLARLTAMCALNEDGTRMFTDLDYKTLMVSVHPAVVGKVGNAIAASARLDMSEKAQADAEGN